MLGSSSKGELDLEDEVGDTDLKLRGFLLGEGMSTEGDDMFERGLQGSE